VGPEELLTVAERSGFRKTSTSGDVRSFIEALQANRGRFRVESIGRSGLGQEMPVMIFGERDPRKPVVLVIANIHAGEVEGKESLLMLARDLPDSCFEKLTLLFLPNYNPDGNDRIDVKNRALDLARLEGQIGPEGGVGTRYTGQGINLNRDYMKLEAPESRNLSRLYGAWSPHLTIDSHTTDGSIHGFALTYDTSHIPTAPCEWVRTALLPEVTRRLDRRTGLKTHFYGNFVDERDPLKGWATYPHLPRYGSHYRGLTGRMDILLESYSYIPFGARVVVTTEILREILDFAIEHTDEIIRRCAEAESWRPDPVGIAYGDPEPSGECEILAWDMESQLARRVPGLETRSYRMPHLAGFRATKTVPRPWAYLVPAAHEPVVRKLREHNITAGRATGSAGAAGEVCVVERISKATSPDIGDKPREETVFAVRKEAQPVRIEAGDVVVRTDQPLGTLAVYLLEPESDDGLARWGFFDSVASPGARFPIVRLPSAVEVPTAPLC
jgi:hypothetical protein